MLNRAILLAVNCHLGQHRKHAIHGQRLPYIAHPLYVMQTVWSWGVVEPDLMAAAVLHDVLEQSNTTPRLLAKQFGLEVANVVQELTHVRQNGDKSQYLETFARATIPAVVIKLADRYCNLRHRQVAAPDKLAAYFAKTAPLLAVLETRRAEIAGRFGAATATAIVAAYDELARAIPPLAGPPPADDDEEA